MMQMKQFRGDRSENERGHREACGFQNSNKILRAIFMIRRKRLLDFSEALTSANLTCVV